MAHFSPESASQEKTLDLDLPLCMCVYGLSSVYVDNSSRSNALDYIFHMSSPYAHRKQHIDQSVDCSRINKNRSFYNL